MSSGRASVEAMDDMIRLLTKVQQLQDDIAKDLRQKYESIGSDWNDEQYQKMEEEISEMIRYLSECSGALSLGTTRLQLRKRMLEEYLNMH